MTGVATTGGAPAWERVALAGLWAMMAGPIAAAGVWRPWVERHGGGGDTAVLSGAACIVALVVVVGRSWGALAGAAVAMACALLRGGDQADVLAAGVSLLATVGVVATLFPVLLRQVPSHVDGVARRQPISAVLVAFVAFVGLFQTTRLSAYMSDAARVDCAPIPAFVLFVRHSCLTAYVQGARLAAAGTTNLYDADWWPDLSGSATSAAEAAAYAPFTLDAFAYPPPFLLLPAALDLLGPSFEVLRAVWFGLSGLLIAWGIWRAGAWIGEADPKAGARVLSLGLLLWVAPLVIITLQVGNAHGAVTVLSVLAMIALERGQRTWGAAMLSFAILSKISPGLLGVVLLVQRRWWDAAATAAWGVVWTALSVVVFGTSPFVAFVQYELPRLKSGEALAFFTRRPLEVALNLAPFGLPFKAQLLGVQVDDVWATGAAIGSAFTLVALVFAVLAGRVRSGDRRIQLSMWLAVLSFAALNSPFAPGYCAFSVLWLATCWPASARPWRDTALVVLLFVVVQVAPPLSDQGLVGVSLVQEALMIGVPAWAVLRAQPRRREA